MTVQENGWRWIADLAAEIEGSLRGWGLGDAAIWLTQVLLLIGLVAAVVVVHFVARPLIVRGLVALSKRTEVQWDDLLAENRVFHRLSHLFSALVFRLAGPQIFAGQELLRIAVERLALAYLAIVGALIIGSFLSAVVQFYRQKFDSMRQRPILAYVQVVKIIVWLVAVVLAVAALLGESPWAFLGGLGALTAVLMLVFKDAILGLVASIQVATNDMVRVGDWIEIPALGLDGEVTEMSLTTIKVQNWDKAVSSFPSYKLITEMFKNWRGMSESGVRRIKEQVPIDVHTIGFLDDEIRARLTEIDLLADYLESRKDHQLTNIGTFRAYLLQYLRAYPAIDKSATLIVKQLAPHDKGAPVQIYVFSKEQGSTEYESIKADILDHIVAMAPRFGLKLFQVRTN